MLSFQNKKMLLPGRDARKNPGHTSECGGRNTSFQVSLANRLGTWQEEQYHLTLRFFKNLAFNLAQIIFI